MIPVFSFGEFSKLINTGGTRNQIHSSLSWKAKTFSFEDQLFEIFSSFQTRGSDYFLVLHHFKIFFGNRLRETVSFS